MKEKKHRQPITAEKIFKLMIFLAYLVSVLFVVKDLAGNDVKGAVIIGAVLAVFTVTLLVMRLLHVKADKQRLVVASSLVVIVFIVSLTTGSYYSDDYSLYLAVIALNGLYFKKSYSYVQTVMADIFLVVQFIIYPQKADPMGQFIMCMATFNLAAVTICLLVSRGNAFIERNHFRAAAAEESLKTMETIGVELGKSFRDSAVHMSSLQTANDTMKESADILEQSSSSISNGADAVSMSCDNVQRQMQETADSIHYLNRGVQRFEGVLNENRSNMMEMSTQMDTVRKTMDETDRVFRELSDQMRKIAAVTDEINQIASNTALLAVNASIEAARAGEAGRGFAVVASNVRELAVSSTRSSNEVAEVVASMQKQIDNTTHRLSDSLHAIATSSETLNHLQGGFGEMMEQFGDLYGNIEKQNANIDGVAQIFDDLKERVSDMSVSSGENHNSVSSITDAIHVYRDNIAAVIEDNRQIHDLTEQMLTLAKSRENDAE